MKSQAFAEAALALFGLCVCLAPVAASAQSTQTTPMPANVQSTQLAPEDNISKPCVRMVRQPLPGEAATQSPIPFKEPTRPKKDWMERHKVLTAIIFAVASVFVGDGRAGQR